jgi:peptide/nickel transport system substrate-binding protein
VERRRSNSRSLVLGGLALAPLLMGSGPDSPFRFGEDRAPTTLNPIFASTMVDTRMEELLFDGLFTYDHFLNPAPSLVGSYKINDERTQVNIFLREGFWHDGKPITAQDVEFTIQVLKDERTRSSAKNMVAEIKSVAVTGPTALTITFIHPMVQPERTLMFKILPKHAFKNAPPMEPRDEFRLNPVGSGPYKFVRWKGTTLELEANHHKTVGLSKLHARFVPDKKAQLDFLLYDGLDALVRVLPRHRPVIEGMAGKVELLPYESLSWWYLGVNHKNPHLEKLEVRRAIAHAIDRDEVRSAHLGDGQTISGPFAPRSPFYNDRVKPYQYDLRAAEALMKKAGYKKVGGIYNKGGRKVHLKLAVNKDWTVYKDVVLDLQTRLRQAGFEVDIDWLDAASWGDRVVKGGDFDLTIGAWSFDEASNVDSLFQAEGRNNFVNYKSERMDQLLVQSQETRDPELFREIYRRVHEHAHNDLPYIFLWSVSSYTAVSSEVTGVDIHPFRYFTWIEDWKWQE